MTGSDCVSAALVDRNLFERELGAGEMAIAGHLHQLPLDRSHTEVPAVCLPDCGAGDVRCW